MLFNAYVFLYAFLPVTWLGYYGLARLGPRFAMAWLIVASCVFYGWWNPAFVPLLAGSITLNYVAARTIIATQARPRLQFWFTATAVSADLGALLHYKYAIWLAALLDRSGLLHLGLHDIVLPLGISFFTFTQIGYLLDCRHGIARQCGVLDYAMFVTFFPHLIAGPILHHGEMMPQFAEPATYRFSASHVAAGLGIFIVGLLKKCLLADPVGAIVPVAYSHPETLPLFAAWQAVLSYSLQLYFDFSGYSDMAIGLALLFNLRFPLNFNSPYKAQSVVDYWQRWHMTLTRYFTQYVYNPLALAAMRRRSARRLGIDRTAQMTPRGFVEMAAVPIFATILMAGLWHGAGATFLVFGLLHAIYLIINRACRIIRPHPPAPSPRAVLRRVGVTYFAVLIASVFFRAPSLTAALAMLGGMLGLHGFGPALPVPEAWLAHGSWLALQAHGVLRPVPWRTAIHAGVSLLRIAVLYGVVWLLPNTHQMFAGSQASPGEGLPPPSPFWRWCLSPRWAVIAGSATTLAALAAGGTSEFLYFQF